nr:DNA replication complex GINS protein SLD5-like [Ipomoea batatas]
MEVIIRRPPIVSSSNENVRYCFFQRPEKIVENHDWFDDGVVSARGPSEFETLGSEHKSGFRDLDLNRFYGGWSGGADSRRRYPTSVEKYTAKRSAETPEPADWCQISAPLPGALAAEYAPRLAPTPDNDSDEYVPSDDSEEDVHSDDSEEYVPPVQDNTSARQMLQAQVEVQPDNASWYDDVEHPRQPSQYGSLFLQIGAFFGTEASLPPLPNIAERHRRPSPSTRGPLPSPSRPPSPPTRVPTADAKGHIHQRPPNRSEAPNRDPNSTAETSGLRFRASLFDLHKLKIEVDYFESYQCDEDVQTHFEQSVLSKLPPGFKSHLKQSSLSEEDDMGPWSSHKLIQVSGILIGMHLKLLMRLVYTLHKLDQICTIFTRGIGGGVMEVLIKYDEGNLLVKWNSPLTTTAPPCEWLSIRAFPIWPLMHALDAPKRHILKRASSHLAVPKRTANDKSREYNGLQN